VFHLPQVRRLFLPLLAALVIGSFTAIVSAVLLAQAFHLGATTVRALAPKLVTATIAVGTTETVGADQKQNARGIGSGRNSNPRISELVSASPNPVNKKNDDDLIFPVVIVSERTSA
jgi:hypothetical protein